MQGVVLLCCLSALLASLVGLIALRRDRSLTRWVFSGGMLSLACERLLNGLSWWTPGAPEGVFWQKAGLFAAAFEPGLWIAFSLVYSRENARESLARWRWVLLLSLTLPLFAALGFGTSVKMIDSPSEYRGVLMYHITSAGRALFVVLLLGAAVVLMNAERTFRASVGLMRWRIKFMMLALVVLFGVRVYTDSQVLLYSAIQPRIESLGALAILVACGLMGWSLVRAGFFEAKVYPSGSVLQGSMTLGVIGLYLLLTGGLAKVLTVFGQHAGLPLKSLLILIALVLLSILFLSDRVRQQAHRFVSQHFHRPLHNYRQLWMAFAERTGSLLQEVDLCREAAKLVAETF